MTEGRQPFTAEIKTLAKGPSTYDPLEDSICRNRNFADAIAMTKEAARAPVAVRGPYLTTCAVSPNWPRARRTRIGVL